eukprot:107419_1
MKLLRFSVSPDMILCERANAEWSLRKAAASSLDTLAVELGVDLLEPLLPILQVNLSKTEEWQVRESGILTLGAIAEGCYTGMKQHMGTLLSFLLQMLGDPHPLVRSISCWTISRYAYWLIEMTHMKVLVPPLMVRWSETALDDRRIFPVMECLTTLAISLGVAFAPFAQQLFMRSVEMVKTVLLA